MNTDKYIIVGEQRFSMDWLHEYYQLYFFGLSSVFSECDVVTLEAIVFEKLVGHGAFTDRDWLNKIFNTAIVQASNEMIYERKLYNKSLLAADVISGLGVVYNQMKQFPDVMKCFEDDLHIVECLKNDLPVLNDSATATICMLVCKALAVKPRTEPAYNAVIKGLKKKDPWYDFRQYELDVNDADYHTKIEANVAEADAIKYPTLKKIIDTYGIPMYVVVRKHFADNEKAIEACVDLFASLPDDIKLIKSTIDINKYKIEESIYQACEIFFQEDSPLCKDATRLILLLGTISFDKRLLNYFSKFPPLSDSLKKYLSKIYFEIIFKVSNKEFQLYKRIIQAFQNFNKKEFVAIQQSIYEKTVAKLEQSKTAV